MKQNKKAFTLVELLVVVLIIGILAAIAVPQYQIAVKKSEFSTLKAKTKALAQAVNVYELATGKKPERLEDLDISLPDVKTNYINGAALYIDFNKEGQCMIWIDNWKKVRCATKDGKNAFYFNTDKLQPYACLAYNDKNEIGHKMCQQENIINIEPYPNYSFYYY